MEKQILSSTPEHQREAIIRDSADFAEELTYPQQLDEDDLNKLREEFALQAIELDKHDQKLKEAREEHKLHAKPIKKEMASQMQMIRTQVREVTEKVYLISDQESGMMGYYNKKGQLIRQRPLMQSERQLRIVNKAQNE